MTIGILERSRELTRMRNDTPVTGCRHLVNRRARRSSSTDTKGDLEGAYEDAIKKAGAS